MKQRQQRQQRQRIGGFSEYAAAGTGCSAASAGLASFGAMNGQHALNENSNVIAVNSTGMVGGKQKKQGGKNNLAKIAVPILLTYAATVVAPRASKPGKTYKGYKGRKFNRSRKFSRRTRS